MDAATATQAGPRALEARRCPQCGGDGAETVSPYSVEPWRLVQCTDCAFVYLKNVPAYEQLVDDLAWEKTFAVETERRREKYPIVNLIERTTRWRLFLVPGKRERTFRRLFREGRVLDVGCSTGWQVPDPFVPFGIEISAALARKADARMSARGGRAICAPATEGIKEFPDRHFSGVVLSSFLEHEVNPKPLMQQVARVVADDGKVYVRVPNFGSVNRRVMGPKWCGFRYPDHVNYFTAASLRRMAADCGFKMRLLNPVTLPLDDNIKAALSKA